MGMSRYTAAAVSGVVLTAGLSAAPSSGAAPHPPGSTTSLGGSQTSAQAQTTALTGATAPTPPSVARASSPRRIALTRWGPRTFKKGTYEHTRSRGGLVLGRNLDRVGYRDPYGSGSRVAYDRGRWYSPWVRERFALTQLIASYAADTPVGTFIEISARGRSGPGTRSSWDSLGRWASHDRNFHRMSLGDQPDDLSRVAVDTLITHDGSSFGAWQLRLTLMRRSGTTKTPTISRAGAMVSRLPEKAGRTSRVPSGRGRDLGVPRYSQEIHRGEYPQWDGGGEAWCSPTSTSMLLSYWNRGPTRKQYAWVNDSYRQPWVDYAARFTFAWGYDGTGDWPFNTAYAARFGLDAFVTRLRSLRQAHLFIKAGVPLVASIGFDSGELDGAPISSTSGHLLVIRGFTRAGKVIVNDPAAPTARTVRRIYSRAQFERAWLGSTGGVVYVIHPADHALPKGGPGRAW